MLVKNVLRSEGDNFKKKGESDQDHLQSPYKHVCLFLLKTLYISLFPLHAVDKSEGDRSYILSYI